MTQHHRVVAAGAVTPTRVPEERYEEWLELFLNVASGVSVGGRREIVEYFRSCYPAGRLIGMTADDGALIGSGASANLDLVVPGDEVAPVTYLNGIAVHPTATRRGLLRAMMTALHRRAADEERWACVLSSTEWPIYERFGYGPTTWLDVLTIDASRVGWRNDAPDGPRPSDVDGPRALEIVERLRTASSGAAAPGQMLRPHSWLTLLYSDSAGPVDALLGRAGTGPRTWAAVGDSGVVSYRLTPRTTAHGASDGTLYVADLFATDDTTRAALWRHLLSIDLVATIVARAPLDDPVRWWVADARHLAPRRTDGLWIRPLDPGRLLERRAWYGTGTVTLRVQDPEGYATQRIRLHVEDDEVEVRQTSDDPQMTMLPGAFGAILLGGTRAVDLTRAGAISCSDLRAAQTWDSLATPLRAPFYAVGM